MLVRYIPCLRLGGIEPKTSEGEELRWHKVIKFLSCDSLQNLNSVSNTQADNHW
jgi:hypothetical protein